MIVVKEIFSQNETRGLRGSRSYWSKNSLRKKYDATYTTVETIYAGPLRVLFFCLKL